MAGEIGHMIIKPDGPLCACDKKGCLEALASSPAINPKEILCLEKDPNAGSILRKLSENNLAQINAKTVSQAASRGDILAYDVLLVIFISFQRSVFSVIRERYLP